MTTASPLRRLLLHRGYWLWTAAAQLAQLPTFMAALGFVLISTHATGSPATGGLMTSAYVLCLTLGAAPAARLIDRLTPVRGAALLLGLAVLALACLATAVALHAVTPLLLLLVGMAGTLLAGIGSGLRTLLSEVVPPELLGPALALQATLTEGTVLAAPLLTAATAAVSPYSPVALMAAAAAVAALLVLRLPRPAAPAGAGPGAGAAPAPAAEGLWRRSGFWFWLVISVAFGHAIGTAEAGALPLAARLGGGPGKAAALIAVISASSALSGLAYAALAHRLALPAPGLARLLLALMAAGCVALAVTVGWGQAATALVLIGAAMAPLDAIRSQAVEGEVPPGRRAEGFGLVGAAHALGYSLGGLCLAVLPLPGMLLAGGVSGAAAVVLAPLLLRRRRPQLPMDAASSRPGRATPSTMPTSGRKL